VPRSMPTMRSDAIGNEFNREVWQLAECQIANC
jgi:hypothetical protein